MKRHKHSSTAGTRKSKLLLGRNINTPSEIEQAIELSGDYTEISKKLVRLTVSCLNR